MASDSQPVEAPGDVRQEAMETKETVAEDSHGSDSDGSRPVRQKLKETSITTTPQEPANDNEEVTKPEETPSALQEGTNDEPKEADNVKEEISSTSAPQESKDNEEATKPEEKPAPLEATNDESKESNKAKEETTTISTLQESKGNDSDEPRGGSDSRPSSRGRKRSFDDDEAENDGEEHGHRRKRSRDSVAESGEQQPQNGDSIRQILSPKKKRSRDQLDKEESTEGPAEQMDRKSENGELEKSEVEGQPEKKRHRDNSTERKPALVTSAFANTSSVSPFGSLGAIKPKEGEPAKAAPVTSNSAFASSSLAAFAGSEQSPFGSLGASTSSIFKKPATTEAEKPATTGFAAAAGTSGFAALGSGFSGFSGGFGAAAKSGGLTSFASPTASSFLGSSTKDKPFGAAGDDEEEEEEEEAETGPKQFEEEKTDERFFEQQIETGEEEEKTYFSCKAKLFHFSNKEWKERGIGTFKVNVKVKDGKEDKKAARMLMRADGVLRVMLNTPIFKGMKIGDGAGKEPNSKHIHLAGIEDGRTIPLLLRTGSEDLAKELYKVIQDLLEHQ